MAIFLHNRYVQTSFFINPKYIMKRIFLVTALLFSAIFASFARAGVGSDLSSAASPSRYSFVSHNNYRHPHRHYHKYYRGHRYGHYHAHYHHGYRHAPHHHHRRPPHPPMPPHPHRHNTVSLMPVSSYQIV